MLVHQEATKDCIECWIELDKINFIKPQIYNGEIFYYKLVDDIIYAQTVIDDNGICHYKEVFISGDCGDEWGNPIEQIETIDFKFDNHGHIVVL